MNPAAEQLLELPDLPEIVEEFQVRLEWERIERARFYDEIDAGTKAEFINGEVVVHSPDRAEHIIVRKRLEKLLDTFVERHNLGLVLSEKALCVFPRNDYMPDVCFWKPEKAALIEANTRKFPAPDFVVEILSDSTESRDRGVKFEDFERHGVEEYWIVDADAKSVEQYVRNGDRLERVDEAGSGRLICRAVGGFEIPTAAVFESEANQAALKELLS